MVKKKRVKVDLFVLVAYSVMALLFTYPLVLKLFTHIPGVGSSVPFIPFGDSDKWMYLWNSWWLQKALVDLHVNPLYTDYIMYPLGIGLVFHTLAIFNSLVSLPLQPLFGLVGSNNMVLLLSFPITAYGTFLLVDYLVGDKVAAFIAGLVFAFCPYKFAQVLAQFDLASTEWIPFYVLFLIKMTREKAGAKNAFLAGLFLLLTALCAYNYLVFLLVFTFLYLAYNAITNHKVVLSLGFLRKLFILLATFAVGFSPILYFAAKEMFAGRYRAVEGWGMGDFFIADLLGFFVPSVYHPLFGELVAKVADNFLGFHAERMVFVGYTVLVLALFASVRFFKNREVKFWIFSGVFFFLLSLGPTLRVLGRTWPPVTLFRVQGLDIGIPLPFIIFHYIPFFNMARVPSRFSLMGMLSMAVLVGYACKLIFSRVPALAKPNSRILTPLVVCGISILISFEYLAIPIPLQDASIPKIYEEITREEGDFTVLEIPLGWRDGFGGWGLENTSVQYFQTMHGKRLLNGMVARIPNNRPFWYQPIPVIGPILLIQHNVPSAVESLRWYILMGQGVVDEVIRYFNIRYIIVHEPFIGKEIDTYIAGVFPAKKVYDAEGVRAYKVTRRKWTGDINIDMGTDLSRMYLIDGWSENKSENSYTFVEMTGEEARVFIPLSEVSKRMLFLRARALRESSSKNVKISVNGKVLSELELKSSWANYRIDIPAEYLKAGLNDLGFKSSAPVAVLDSVRLAGDH